MAETACTLSIVCGYHSYKWKLKRIVRVGCHGVPVAIGQH